MIRFYARRFDIAGAASGPLHCFITELRRWLTQQLGELPAFEDGPWVEYRHGSTVWWEPFVTDDDRLFEATWEFPRGGGGAGTWIYRSSLLRTNGLTRLELVAEFDGLDEPTMLPPWPTPPLVEGLSRLVTLEFGGCKCTAEPELLTGDGIRGLVEEELFSPSRRYPVIVCGPRVEGGQTPIDRGVIRDFLGLGRVVFIREQDDHEAFSLELGSTLLSCPPAGLRAYMPGLSRGSRAIEHPILSEKATQDGFERARFAKHLSCRIAEDFTSDPDLSRLRAVRAHLRYTRYRELSSKGEAAERDLADWRGLAEEADRDNRSLRTELTSLQAQLVKTEQSVRFLQGRIQQLSQGPTIGESDSVHGGDGTASDGVGVVSVEEAVRMASELFAATLYFLPSAFSSASASPFVRPGEVLAAIEALSEVAALLHHGPLGMPLRDAFTVRGQDYALGIGASSSKRIRKEYIFRHEGAAYCCEEHLKIGSGYDPASCLRIYFCSRPTFSGRIVIGHVGRHLSTATSST